MALVSTVARHCGERFGREHAELPGWAHVPLVQYRFVTDLRGGLRQVLECSLREPLWVRGPTP